MSILVVGSIAFDTVNTPFGSCERALGGAANFFAMTASLSSKVLLCGVVGDDFPKNHLDYLSQRGVDLAGVMHAAGKTFHWRGAYGDNFNEAQTLQTDLNVFADFKPDLPQSYREAEMVFLANIDPALQLKVLSQVHKPRLTALDTMNFWIERKNAELKSAISKVDILFVNEAELRQLAGESDTYHAARSLGLKTIVIKRGECGSLLYHNDEFLFMPAFPVEKIYDPTGAGDTFAAGFMAHLDQLGRTDLAALKEAMVMGTVMASFVIEDFSFDRIKRLERFEIEERRKAPCFL